MQQGEGGARVPRTEDALFCLPSSLGDPAEVLAKLLGGPVKCYVPRCVLLELKGLGTEFSGKQAWLSMGCMHE